MINIDFLDKKYRKSTENLLKEAEPLLQGEPKVWIQSIGEQVSYGEHFGQFLKASIPLVKSNLRADMLVFHELPISEGALYVVLPFSRKIPLPIDLLIRLKGKLPRSVVLKPGLLSPDWYSSEGDSFSKTKDDFCEYLANAKIGKEGNIKNHVRWKLEISRDMSMKLDWALQLLPLSVDTYLLIAHQPYDPNIWSWGLSKARLHDFINIIGWIEIAIDQYKYDGKFVKPAFLKPTQSILCISELTGDTQSQSNSMTSNKPVIPKQEENDNVTQEKNSPIAIAKERLAKGEISADEYKKIKKLLEES